MRSGRLSVEPLCPTVALWIFNETLEENYVESYNLAPKGKYSIH